MKRILSLFLVICVVVIMLSGCYTINAGSLDEVIGTYEMTVYETTGLGDDPLPSFNYIEEGHAVSYLVISDRSSGYYYYKDDSTPATCHVVELRLTESTDEEDLGKFEYVEFRTSSEAEWEKLGIDVSSFLFGDHILNRTDRTHAGNIFDGNYHATSSTTRKFKRISRDTDLKTLKKKVGDISVIPFT